MADKKLISAIEQFQTDQLQDGHITADFRKSVEREINTVENTTSNLGPEATAESKAESKKLKNEGNILMKQEKHLEELANYTKAIQLDDQNAAYYCNRAFGHIMLGHHALAIKDCHTALSIDPAHSNAYAQLGHNILMKLEKHHEAPANYTKAIQLDSVVAYPYRAVGHTVLGNPVLTIKDSLTVLSIDPLNSKAYTRLGLAFCNLGIRLRKVMKRF